MFLMWNGNYSEDVLIQIVYSSKMNTFLGFRIALLDY